MQYVPPPLPVPPLTVFPSHVPVRPFLLSPLPLPSSARITFMDKTTLGEAAVLGIEYVSSLPSHHTPTPVHQAGREPDHHRVQLARHHLLLQLSHLPIPSKSRPPTLSRWQVDEVLLIPCISSLPTPLTAPQASTYSFGQSSSAPMQPAPPSAVSLPSAFSSESARVLSPPDS